MEGKQEVMQVDAEFGTIKGLGKAFYEAGIFEDIKSEAQAIVKIIAGKEFGLSPIESMNGLYIVKGRVVPMSNVISSLIKRSKEYDYQVKTLTDEACILVFTRNAEPIGESSFSMKDAAKALLANKETWKSYPRNMMFNRALANGCRWYCPHIFSGSVAEEIQDLAPAQPQTSTVAIETTGEVTSGK
jgi:hypothetical protein